MGGGGGGGEAAVREVVEDRRKVMAHSQAFGVEWRGEHQSLVRELQISLWGQLFSRACLTPHPCPSTCAFWMVICLDTVFPYKDAALACVPFPCLFFAGRCTK